MVSVTQRNDCILTERSSALEEQETTKASSVTRNMTSQARHWHRYSPRFNQISLTHTYQHCLEHSEFCQWLAIELTLYQVWFIVAWYVNPPEAETWNIVCLTAYCLVVWHHHLICCYDHHLAERQRFMVSIFSDILTEHLLSVLNWLQWSTWIKLTITNKLVWFCLGKIGIHSN